MPRPTTDVNGTEYSAVLRAREMYRLYGADHKDMMWAGETVERLERKLAHGDYTDRDRADFLKVKEIHARVFIRRKAANEETTTDHPTTHYIWRTEGDDRVRPEHAANDGEIFAWANPPPTGHPGATFGCRCTAVPTSARITSEELRRLNRNAPPGTPPADLEIDPRFGLPRWYVGGAVSPTISPLDLVGGTGAVRAATNLIKVTSAEAVGAVRVIWGRITGQRAAEESIARIRNAADAVEEFLGGRPDPKDVKVKQRGDITITKGDKKFRMDIDNTGFKRDPDGRYIPEEPHFHLQKLKKNGKWGDATKEHRLFFRKDGE